MLPALSGLPGNVRCDLTLAQYTADHKEVDDGRHNAAQNIHRWFGIKSAGRPEYHRKRNSEREEKQLSRQREGNGQLGNPEGGKSVDHLILHGKRNHTERKDADSPNGKLRLLRVLRKDPHKEPPRQTG